MFGYLLGIVLAVFLVAIVLMAMARSGPRRGRRDPQIKPVQAEEPAADEPTPDRSATASPREMAASRRRTPPA